MLAASNPSPLAAFIAFNFAAHVLSLPLTNPSSSQPSKDGPLQYFLL